MKYLIDGEEVELKRYEECLWGEIYRQEAASCPNKVEGWKDFLPYEQGLVICYYTKDRFTQLKIEPQVELFSLFEQRQEAA